MTLDAEIDRNSYVPFYIQVKEALRDHFGGPDVNPGDQLPGEPELCRIFDVSRTVIRQALGELEHEGLIVREKGRGTFVAVPKIEESLFQTLTGFYQDMAAKGHAPVSQILRQETIPASPKIAGYLKIEPETDVIVIDRLRLVQDEPIVLVTTYLPYSLFPLLLEADLRHQSLYAYLEEVYGMEIVRGQRVLEAIPANEYEAELLNIDKGAPVIMLDSISYLEDGQPIEYFHALHRGDRSRFEVELIRVREGKSNESITPTEIIKHPG